MNRNSDLLKTTCWTIALLLIGAFATGENWPGYEGTLHQNASAVDVSPAGLAVLWERQFNYPVVTNPGWQTDMYNPGFYGSRNLTLYEGNLAVVAVPDNGTYPAGKAFVTILDTDNNILNVIQTNQDYGPKWDQGLGDDDSGETSCWMEAYDTGDRKSVV